MKISQTVTLQLSCLNIYKLMDIFNKIIICEYERKIMIG
jgi:hypothetical protein